MIRLRDRLYKLMSEYTGKPPETIHRDFDRNKWLFADEAVDYGCCDRVLILYDGKVVRVPIPALTDERRKELSRHVHKQAEEGRNIVRQARRLFRGNAAMLQRLDAERIDHRARGLAAGDDALDRGSRGADAVEAGVVELGGSALPQPAEG